MQVERQEEKAKSGSVWQKVGICRVSMSKKVLLLAIFELESHRWLIVDVSELLELIAGHRCDISIMEKDVHA
jgi:hypothetical protein